jgi:sporulation protein YlmC with PRC-barrel domain
MNIRVSSVRGKKVYTSVGKYLGHVNSLKFDVKKNKVASLSVKIDRRVKRLRSRVISIPYNWVAAVGDIVIIDKKLSESWSKRKESNIQNKDFIEV